MEPLYIQRTHDQNGDPAVAYHYLHATVFVDWVGSSVIQWPDGTESGRGQSWGLTYAKRNIQYTRRTRGLLGITHTVPYVTDSGSEGQLHYVGHQTHAPGLPKDAVADGSVGRIDLAPEGQVSARFTPPCGCDVVLHHPGTGRVLFNQWTDGECEHTGKSIQRALVAIQQAWDTYQQQEVDA